jgi:hypothetical protein
MNKEKKIIADRTIKLYSNLKFQEKNLVYLKNGDSAVLEETGKIYIDQEGKEHKVFRLRRNSRTYFVIEEL